LTAGCAGSKISPRCGSCREPERTEGFVHPVGAEFARLLGFNHIAWECEPRTFPLATDEDRSVLEAITSDFYLPGHDLSIELTTLRHALARLKHRKIRRMRQLSPDVSIKLIDRKQMIVLQVKYGTEADLPNLVTNPAYIDAAG
jgi:bifunctional protein TilS/HprT